MRKGFTLIELLVVVAIIAMVLSFIFVQLREARARSRDAAREANMKDFQNALQLYTTSTGLFPVCPGEVMINGKDDCFSAALLGERSTSGVSIDPIGGSTGACGGADSYVYCYQSSNGSSYTLRYRLETNSISGKSAGWQTATP